MTTAAKRPLTPSSASDPSAECARARLRLQEFVDGEVDECAAAEVLAHVSQCEACSYAEAALRHLIEAVQRSQLPVLASRRLRLRITQHFADADAREWMASAPSSSAGDGATESPGSPS
jgi:anti-sigma factor RsiW